MNKYYLFGFSFLFLLWGCLGYAATCPDPETTSLKWGEPPEPWIVSPFSPYPPQAEDGTRFVRANILVVQYGRGVVCTYRNSLGEYSIWWETLTKIPAQGDYNWISTLGGFVCTQGIDRCQFSVAEY